MEKVRVRKGEAEFLRNECNSEVLNKYLSNGEYEEETSCFILMLTVNDVKILIEELSRLLIDRGVGQDGEINDFGKSIDALISRFDYYE